MYSRGSASDEGPFYKQSLQCHEYNQKVHQIYIQHVPIMHFSTILLINLV